MNIYPLDCNLHLKVALNLKIISSDQLILLCDAVSRLYFHLKTGMLAVIQAYQKGCGISG